jgi:hypothetical protein
VKVILELAVESEDEHEEALEYVASLQRAVESRRWQGFPGALLERGDVSVWVASVEVEPTS